MRERPILFSGEMVRAILDGSKTQTRRVVKKFPPNGLMLEGEADEWCPYGNVGDRLWARETWQKVYVKRDGFYTTEPREGEMYPRTFVEYAATAGEEPPRWRPSIFMPRWASRITLEIVSVRVERLHDISEDDARAEGCLPTEYEEPFNPSSARTEFKNLWDSINEKRGFGWNTNPFVWVIEFKPV